MKANHAKADLGPIERACEVAMRMQLSKGSHAATARPFEVAMILAEIGMTVPSVVAALLHATLDETTSTLEELRADFGDEVAQLVDGVAKLDKVKYGDTAQAETIRKMIVAMSRDIRVLVIKLANWLHNLRALALAPQDGHETLTRETLDIWVPLAERLGMVTIKLELEDIAFKALHPKIYDEITRMVDASMPSREAVLAEATRQISADLRAAKIRAKVVGRIKPTYSIYRRMIIGGRDFSDIYDVVGIRVLVDEDRDCYSALGVLHSRWNPVLGRFKDFIAMPTFNMYQSLHTTVMGPQGKPIEVQIRTYAMHRRAEYGSSARWTSRDAVVPATTGDPDIAVPSRSHQDDVTWVRQLLDWQSEVENPGEFLESLRFEIDPAAVYVFTPRGDVIALPIGSTPVDFAYAVHTEVGHRTIGARVNGRLVPLESTLDNGDVVEMFTSKSDSASPSGDWLNFVKSPRARSGIRRWFTQERRDEAIEHGKDQITNLMLREGLPPERLLSQEVLSNAASQLSFADISALYAAVGEGTLSAATAVRRMIDLNGEAATPQPAAKRPAGGTSTKSVPDAGILTGTSSEAGVVVRGAEGLSIKLARCCTPVPGDGVVGWLGTKNEASIHRTDCPNLSSMGDTQRLDQVSWSSAKDAVYRVNIQVEASNRAQLLSDITGALSDAQVNIVRAQTTSRDRVAKSRFTCEVRDIGHLDRALSLVGSVPGVFAAHRLLQ